jgi:hypothetical protein
MKFYMDIRWHLERNLLNIYRSETYFEQKLKRNMKSIAMWLNDDKRVLVWILDLLDTYKS